MLQLLDFLVRLSDVCMNTCYGVCVHTTDDEYHYHSMALENLNYDLCGTCFHSVDEKEKDIYWPTKLSPWTQYAQVVFW